MSLKSIFGVDEWEGDRQWMILYGTLESKGQSDKVLQTPAAVVIGVYHCNSISNTHMNNVTHCAAFLCENVREHT